MRRHTLWHLSSCCALRTCSNTLHPSTPLSLQLLSPPLALILFLPPPNAPHVPWGGLSLIFSHLSISCHRHLPLFISSLFVSSPLFESSAHIQGHGHTVLLGWLPLDAGCCRGTGDLHFWYSERTVHCTRSTSVRML